jgi:hypothetical protein
MIKVLKIAMIVWSVIGILLGLGFIISPEQLISMAGFEKGPAYMPYFLTLLGIAYLSSGIFMVIAARDPLKHIILLQLVIVWSLVDALAASYFIIRGNVSFSQVGWVPIYDGIFVIAFLALYPWRKVSGG